MTNHPNRGPYQYLKVSPRGFANEVLYLRVPAADVDAANAEFAGYEDRTEGGHVSWTHDTKARWTGVAVDWADRDMVLPVIGRDI